MLVIAATIAEAIDDIELTIDAIDGAGWNARDLRARLELSAQGERAELWITTLKLAQMDAPIREVHVRCPTVDISTTQIACKGASVLAQMPVLGEQRFHADVVYGRTDDSIQFAVREIKLGAGQLAFNGSLRDAGWQIDARLQQISVGTLVELASTLEVAVPITVASGTIDIDLQASGTDTQPASVAAKGAVHELAANNESGTLASDRLTLGFEARANAENERWRYDVSIDARGGQAYAEPVFLDFDAHAMKAAVRGDLEGESKATVEHFSIDHTDVLVANGRAVVDIAAEQPVRDLDLAVGTLQFPGAYESYLQPFLLDTNFKSLRTVGSLAGEVVVKDGAPERAEFALHGIGFDGGDVSIQDLSGIVRWQDLDDSATRPSGPLSELRWAGGALYGLEFGQAVMKFAAQERNVRLLEPVRIPLLDGALQLDSLRVRNAGMPNVAFMIDATIEPISVQHLCQAFGWPEFGGRLGGTISKLRMRDGVITLGTTLEAHVFDGVVRVSDLRLEEPFGPWPRFYSSIHMENLDLELVTGAFSFGKITGRMEGVIQGLELFNWSPIAFDARLFTPPKDRSRRLISQRAVENIGSIGGGGAGVTAALSSGVLKFFDDFRYSRLGISCKLRNEVCEMDGVAPAPNGGYYLVQGRGLPRIDVIGNSRRVDWPRLVQQLIAATESGGPVVD